MLRSDVPKTPHETENLTVVTDMWLERCLHRTECVDPQADPTSTPFRLFPIPGLSATLLTNYLSLISEGFESTIVCSTAFRGVDLLHLSKAAQLMGIDVLPF